MDANTPIRNKKQFCFVNTSNTYIAEIRDLQLNFAPAHIILEDVPGAGDRMTFNYLRTDKDGSGEDIYGWHYDSGDHKTHVLITND